MSIASSQGGYDINNPMPLIKANHSDGLVTLTTDDSLSISVELYPASNAGSDADWWVAAYSNSFGWLYYDLGQGWIPMGNSLNNISVCYQGPLFTLSSVEILSASGELALLSYARAPSS